MLIGRYPQVENPLNTSLISDYLNEEEKVQNFYRYSPNLKGLLASADARTFSEEIRKDLVNEIKKQYQDCQINPGDSPKLQANLELLSQSNGLTVTTGHQLNLFTGPYFFIVKIMQAINMAKDLQKQGKNVVPVYWMATEDHDFAEINHFFFGDKKYAWESEQTGGVGRFSVKELLNVLTDFGWASHESGKIKLLEKDIRQFIESAENLSQFTRKLVHHLFTDYGIIILDADCPALKAHLIPYIKKDVFAHFTHEAVSRVNAELSTTYKIQVNPREINYFYLVDQYRSRLVSHESGYQTADGKYLWTETELETEIETNPERFSPNVLNRPLYQEVILPNICYIGGGGEIAYWLQLKASFEKYAVPFPVLWVRTSMVFVPKKIHRKMIQMNLEPLQLCTPHHEKVNFWVQENSVLPEQEQVMNGRLDAYLTQVEEVVKNGFSPLSQSFESYKTMQKKALDKMFKKLKRLEKRKHETAVNRLEAIHENCFPSGVFQERRWNYFYLKLLMNVDIINILSKQLNGTESELLVIGED